MAKPLPIKLYRFDSKTQNQELLGFAATEQEALDKLRALEQQFPDCDGYHAINTRTGQHIDTTMIHATTQAGQLGVL